MILKKRPQGFLSSSFIAQIIVLLSKIRMFGVILIILPLGTTMIDLDYPDVN